MRLAQKTSPGIYVAIACSMVAIFAVDIWTPAGIAVWLFFLVPITLCMLTRQPQAPVIVATISTALMILGFLDSRSQLAAIIVQSNRVIGIAILWGAAIAVRQMIAANIALRRQTWLRETQAMLEEIHRGEQGLRQLAERTLRFLVQRFGAQGACLYMVEPHGLERTASLGIEAPDALPVQLPLGEGLLGEVASIGTAQRFTDLPADYLRIGSTMGSGNANSLLITPALFDGELIAMIELGFFAQSFRDDTEALDWLAEAMGSALNTARLRSQRTALLEETQRQAEELQTQQEELRVSNEELEQHSQHLRESQRRLEQQQAELEQSNVLLEERGEMLERQNEALRMARASLSEKARELERASQYKSEFLANMSHELRTPLNSTLILAKLLADNKRGNLDTEQIKFAQTIYSSGTELLELINDILDLSKVETGNVDIQAENIDLRSLVEGVLQGIRPLAANKGLACQIDWSPQAPSQLVSDAQRVRQVLKNLLSNAVKFTERGSVTVVVEPVGDGGAALTVVDTGIGIAPEQQDIIFEPFRQADGTTNRKYGGTGLGLSISRQLAQLLGGDIELVSSVGSGSRFTLRLPAVCEGGVRKLKSTLPMPPTRPLPVPPKPARVAPPANPSAAEPIAETAAETQREIVPTPESGEGRLLLIVEDDAVFADTVARIARDAGFDTLIAGSADDGISLASQHLPAAIVLDIGLPDHTGLSVLDRLKHNPTTRHIPVQVVSAADHRRPALEMGAAGVMLKPVRMEELVDALNALETRSQETPRRILVVEDDPVQRESIKRLLDELEVETNAVDTAGAALELLGQLTFDCMVMDLNLPDASGYQLLETMAQDERYSFPPVIVYTGRSIGPDEEQLLRRYSRSIIIKGAKSPERLLDEVTLFLHQVESSLPPDRQRMLADARSRDAMFEGRRILLVEDDVRNIFALTRVLEPAGADLRIARNGREAVEAIEGADGDIDLVLMDVMMPEMDGLEATRRIRAMGDRRRADTPIIALTAKAMPDDQQRCLQAGVNDYVSKPIDIDKLMSLIRVWLPR